MTRLLCEHINLLPQAAELGLLLTHPVVQLQRVGWGGGGGVGAGGARKRGDESWKCCDS